MNKNERSFFNALNLIIAFGFVIKLTNIFFFVFLQERDENGFHSSHRQRIICPVLASSFCGIPVFDFH